MTFLLVARVLDSTRIFPKSLWLSAWGSLAFPAEKEGIVSYGFTGCCCVTRDPLLSWNDVLAYGNKFFFFKPILLLAHMMLSVWTRVGGAATDGRWLLFWSGGKKAYNGPLHRFHGHIIYPPSWCEMREPAASWLQPDCQKSLSSEQSVWVFLYLFTFDGYKASRKTRNPQADALPPSPTAYWRPVSNLHDI